MAGLKKDPPDDKAVEQALQYLEKYFRRHFPDLIELARDLAFQTLEECLREKVADADHAGRVISHARYLGKAMRRAAKRFPTVPIDGLTPKNEASVIPSKDLLIESLLAASDAEEERRARQESFNLALEELLSCFSPKEEVFYFEALEVFRRNPKSGWTDVAKHLNITDSAVRQRVFRLRGPLEAILKKKLGDEDFRSLFSAAGATLAPWAVARRVEISRRLHSPDLLRRRSGSPRTHDLEESLWVDRKAVLLALISRSASGIIVQCDEKSSSLKTLLELRAEGLIERGGEGGVRWFATAAGRAIARRVVRSVM